MPAYNSEDIKWPAPLSESLKEKLLSIAFYGNDFKPKMPVNNKPQRPGVYYLISGLATFSYSTPNMKNIRGCVFGQGDWLGANSLYNETGLFLVPEQLEKISFLYFPKDKITQLIETTPEVYQWLFDCVCSAQPKIMQSQLTAVHDKTCRIVYTLLELKRYSPTLLGTSFPIKISQQQLSTVTGISRPRINEVLKLLEKKQQISLQRGAIHLLDLPALNDYLDALNTMFHDPRDTFT